MIRCIWFTSEIFFFFSKLFGYCQFESKLNETFSVIFKHWLLCIDSEKWFWFNCFFDSLGQDINSAYDVINRTLPNPDRPMSMPMSVLRLRCSLVNRSLLGNGLSKRTWTSWFIGFDNQFGIIPIFLGGRNPKPKESVKWHKTKKIKNFMVLFNPK